jgi:DNA-binding transcriptional LysR family regulator
MVPPERLATVLRGFASEFPTVQLRLHVEALGAISAMVHAGTATIGVSGPLAAEIPEIDGKVAGATLLVPVAAPDHPLGRMTEIHPGAGRDYIQLVLSDRSGTTAGRDFGVVSSKTWRLADLGAKHALLREGIGWGNMPLPMIEGDLAAGTLVRLAMPDHPGGAYRFTAIWRRDTPPGPAARWLLDKFVALGVPDAEACNTPDV